MSLVEMNTNPGAWPLPALLRHTGLKGWAAEGMTRVYVTESTLIRWPDHFRRLDVGPSTAQGIWIRGAFELDRFEQPVVEFDGQVRFT